MLSENQKYLEGYFIKRYYPNGQLAVFFQNYKSEPIAELSIFKNSVELGSNEIILKNYSENVIIAQDLLESNILIPTDRFALIGSHLCPICRIAV
ncbi:MAG: hypothetical protein ACFFAH_01415 [Promethearchaeota archaeon]